MRCILLRCWLPVDLASLRERGKVEGDLVVNTSGWEITDFTV